MPHAQSAGARIYYEVEGTGDPVVLLPGLGMATGAWADARERLRGSHTVVAIDPRGAGQSDKPDEPYSGEAVAADVVAVLDAAGLDRAHVVGHSMGGMIAQELALRHPDRVSSLVLVATYAVTDDWSRRVLEVRRTMIERIGLAEHFRMSVLFVFSPLAFRTMPAGIAAIEQRLRDSPPDPRGYMRQLDFCLAHDAAGRVGSVTAPVLVVSGGADFLTSAIQGRELAELIPGARFHEYPAASHGLVWEEAAAFADLVRDFVSAA